MCAQINSNSLTLALPKQEKLKAPIIQFLDEKGFDLECDGETGVLVDRRQSIPNIRVEFVRAADALLLMEKKIVDFAIIGSDVADENTCGDNPNFERPQKKFDLGIARCRFDLAVPQQDVQKFMMPANVDGLKIATSYPTLLQAWLKKNEIAASEIVVREGGVESSIRLGLANVVADLVDSGKTLTKNGLTSAFRIADTSAVCYMRKDADVLTEMRVDEVVRAFRASDKPIVIRTPSHDVAYEMA